MPLRESTEASLGIPRQNYPLAALLTLMGASLLALPLLPSIPQPQSYHRFADQRALLGIANFWNVVSSLVFIPIGIVGLWRFRRDAAVTVLFLGVFLTGFGSAFYHLDPNDGTMFWDRLPMSLTFAAILAVLVEERVSARAGAILLWPLIALAVFSLLLWRWTDDLRLYGWVQFFPCLAVPLLLVVLPARYTGTSWWIVMAALYVLAKLLEFYDGTIYAAGHILSGHALKHLAAAAGCVAILRHFQTRRPIP
ncbi:MAG TPA: ceramidase domain-containing protein [Xanthobacteraceae bacterium]